MPRPQVDASTVRAARKAGVVAVARAAGVSASTVSNVYNRPQVVTPAMRQRVLQAAAEVGYDGADPAARSLRHGRTNAIGVVMRERLAYAFDDPAVVRLMQGISEAADPQQLAIVIVPSSPERGTTTGPAARHAVDGLILYSLAGDDPLIEATRHRHAPKVVVDSPRRSDSAAADPFDFVGIDEQKPSMAVVRHLLDLGHRNLGVISTRLSARDQPGPADLARQRAATASVPRGRLAGAARAFSVAGLDWSRVPVVQCRISNIEAGRAAAHTLLDLAPDTTAVFAFSDPLALGARLAAHERGLPVPGQLSIVGFDDSAPLSEGLTTVHQPLHDKGYIAANRLMRAMAGQPPKKVKLLPTELIIRDTTSRPARR